MGICPLHSWREKEIPCRLLYGCVWTALDRVEVKCAIWPNLNENCVLNLSNSKEFGCVRWLLSGTLIKQYLQQLEFLRKLYLQGTCPSLCKRQKRQLVTKFMRCMVLILKISIVLLKALDYPRSQWVSLGLSGSTWKRLCVYKQHCYLLTTWYACW